MRYQDAVTSLSQLTVRYRPVDMCQKIKDDWMDGSIRYDNPH